MLRVLARELGDAAIDPNTFTHVARWDAENEWVELRLRSWREQVIGVLDVQVPFAEGEELRTEISAKSRRERVADEFNAAGFELGAVVDRHAGPLRAVPGRQAGPGDPGGRARAGGVAGCEQPGEEPMTPSTPDGRDGRRA